MIISNFKWKTFSHPLTRLSFLSNKITFRPAGEAFGKCSKSSLCWWRGEREIIPSCWSIPSTILIKLSSSLFLLLLAVVLLIHLWSFRYTPGDQCEIYSGHWADTFVQKNRKKSNITPRENGEKRDSEKRRLNNLFEVALVMGEHWTEWWEHDERLFGGQPTHTHGQIESRSVDNKLRLKSEALNVFRSIASC